MRLFRSFMMAWGMFFAVPCPSKQWDEKNRNIMLLMLPFIGLIIGAIGYGCCLAMKAAGLNTVMEAAVLTALPLVLTGCIHADGYMDVCDAVLSRRDRTERIKILKDSHTGAFAVISLALMLLVYCGSLCGMLAAGDAVLAACLFTIPVMTRAASVSCIFVCRPLAVSQYSSPEWQAKKKMAAAAVLIGGVLLAAVSLAAGLISGSAVSAGEAAAAAAAAYAGAMITGHCARKDLGGMNGDISGFMITAGELTGVAAAGILAAL